MTEIRNSQGVSLVEVMVAVGIVGIISLGVAQLISTVSQVQSNVSIVVVRDQLGSQYAGFLDMADSRIHTLAANTDLYNHAHGIAPAPAGEFESDTNVYPLAIYDHNNELLIPESGLFLTKSGSVCSADGLPANSCSPEKAWFQVKADWVANAGTSHQI